MGLEPIVLSRPGRSVNIKEALGYFHAHAPRGVHMSSRTRRFLFWTTNQPAGAHVTYDSRSRAYYWLRNYRFPVARVRVTV
jgi:hypothetical protein